jgi:UDP-2-acetamido-3-amino-2,3-dideoxy-glucuronate N-acetyltransferase
MKPYIHESSVVDQNAKIGERTKIWHFSHISRNSVFGESCSIGQNVYIGEEVVIGSNVKIQNNVSVYQGVSIEDYVFCGPSCVFTNDLTPRSKYSKQKQYKQTLVKYGSTIGANATILCGIEIGCHAVIGAGAVVTKSVLDHSIVMGSPAKHYSWACECGEKLDKDLLCRTCHRKYDIGPKGLYEKD